MHNNSCTAMIPSVVTRKTQRRHELQGRFWHAFCVPAEPLESLAYAAQPTPAASRDSSFFSPYRSISRLDCFIPRSYLFFFKLMCDHAHLVIPYCTSRESFARLYWWRSQKSGHRACGSLEFCRLGTSGLRRDRDRSRGRAVVQHVRLGGVVAVICAGNHVATASPLPWLRTLQEGLTAKLRWLPPKHKPH
jgi:hypothetical protein